MLKYFPTSEKHQCVINYDTLYFLQLQTEVQCVSIQIATLIMHHLPDIKQTYCLMFVQLLLLTLYASIDSVHCLTKLPEKVDCATIHIPR